MSMENVEVVHDCFPEQFRMGEVRFKLGKEIEEEGKQKRGTTERSTAGS